jgi:hypothetical protein
MRGYNEAFVGQLKDLYNVFPGAKDLFKIVYFPTNAILRDQLMPPDDEDEASIEATVQDMYNEGVDSLNTLPQDLREFQLWSYVKKHFIDISLKGKVAPQTVDEANEWLDTLDDLSLNSKMSFKEKKKFLKLAQDTVKDIFKDPLVKIVITTSNNSDQL